MSDEVLRVLPSSLPKVILSENKEIWKIDWQLMIAELLFFSSIEFGRGVWQKVSKF